MRKSGLASEQATPVLIGLFYYAYTNKMEVGEINAYSFHKASED
jgi:hypothetical protein